MIKRSIDYLYMIHYNYTYNKQFELKTGEIRMIKKIAVGMIALSITALTLVGCGSKSNKNVKERYYTCSGY